MSTELSQVMSTDDTNLLHEAVGKYTGGDLESLAGDINRCVESNLLPNAIKLQWSMINMMSRTIIHLRRQNAAMADDYKRGK